MADYLKEKRKSAVTLLIFIIIIIDLVVGTTIFVNSSYETETYSYYELKSFRLQDSNNNSISISFSAYFHSEGPISANNPIVLDKIHFNSIITDYVEDNETFHLPHDYNEINVTDSHLFLYFSIFPFDSAIPLDEYYNVSIPQVDSFNRSYYFIPTADDVTGTLMLSGEGNARINCRAGLMTNNDTYLFTDESDTERIMFTLQPTSEYLEYKNNQISMALLVIAAITFSLPITIKVITEMYWGKEKEAMSNGNNEDNEPNDQVE